MNDYDQYVKKEVPGGTQQSFNDISTLNKSEFLKTDEDLTKYVSSANINNSNTEAKDLTPKDTNRKEVQ